MTIAYIALGSNLGNPAEQIETALQSLAELEDTELLACSPWYRSAAIGPGEQADYINAVARLETGLSAPILLRALQSIENAQGRQRNQRWGARTLDLDILLFGMTCVDSAELTVPHPRMRQRPFVLYPLFDLAPNLALPCGTPIASLLARCPRQDLRRIDET
jgi:2-amino-4-hydroxy-6-hydroxymethyldihydropteridine diphosphokinase